MSYPQRVWANLVPLSEGDTLPEAFEEWSFTDNVQDHEEPIETCQLCELTHPLNPKPESVMIRT